MVSLWWATWLNVFYCVKVTNFTHPLFAWLKLRIGMLMPRILGISLLAFIICTYIFPPNLTSVKDDLTQNLPENMNQSEVQEKYEFSSFQLAFNTISFGICVSASVLLLYSLWRHTRNLKKTGLSTKDISTQAHLRVMKPLLLLLFFYVLHFAAMIIVFTSIIPYGKLERLITDMVLLLYPAAHSIILIFTNPKLNKAYIHAIHIRRSAS
ncbi:taste receptor type 2 member 119-like [Sphaerodactylus townsendi]|uniref:taste receptor type 2 member 119-like n=1 Tax=Sphaerodactylus townsendi TaxID=933632 RepID=UPI002026102A|nr:taste receptor type 2 member 119-like [Sphaerodactylus townsendi]